jgi:hypothetical protein
MRSYQHLSGEDREEIAVLRAAGSVAFALYPSHRHRESLGKALPRYRVKKRSVLVGVRRSALH